MFKRTMVLMLLAECMAASVVWGKTFSIDLRPTAASADVRIRKSAKLAVSLQEKADGTLRKVNLDAGAADVGEVAVGDELSFTLFDDVMISLTLKEKMPSPLGGDVFLAEASGYQGVKNAVVLRTADGLTIDVQDFTKDKAYKVISSSAGVNVMEIKPPHNGKCGCDSLEPPAAVRMQSSEPTVLGNSSRTTNVKSAPLLLSSVANQVDTCVDVLVAYDKNAVMYANNNGGGMTNFAQIAVQKMNAALANTGLDESFRFRLVGVVAINAEADDVHDGLHAIGDDVDGWKDVKAARDAVGADIVTTLIDTGTAYGTTGVGWSLASGMVPSSFSENAYNVCAIRSVERSNTMAHECGHNMGAGHSDIQSTQPGPLFHEYSSGYYFIADGNAYSTIMAYEDENPSGASTTEIPFFSSPDYTYEGEAVGDALHDNTRTLRDTYQHVAQWRAQKVPMSYDVVFEPESGSLIDGSLDVTLSPGKAGTEIRYTVDGSDPTLSSQLYTGPIKLSAKTTIKAVTVVDGKCSLPYEAVYYSKSDIGYALGLSDFEWKLSVPGTSLCGVQTTNTIDGVALGATVAEGDVCSFSTTISGPATITWKRIGDGYVDFQVLSDGKEIYSEAWWGYVYSWEELQADIPAGDHVVEFRLGSDYEATMYWFDDFHVCYTAKPTFEPAMSASTGSVGFTNEVMVSIVHPDADCMIYYTLDGSDPNGNGAILYDGPFFLSKSTHVKAIAVVQGKGASAIADGVYAERHAPKAGEWTLWGDGAYDAVAKSGRMIAELCWNLSGCYWSQKLEPVITSDAFTMWAELNGIYLLADSWGDKPGAFGSRFSALYIQTDLCEELSWYTYYPTFVFAAAGDVSTCLGAMLARNDSQCQTNGMYYRDTVESLAACFASFLGGGKPLGVPVASVTDAYGKTFPFSVALSNTNGTGTIYYTLDGSAPTREKGIRYTGAISIPSSGTTLKAVVWPDGVNAVSGIPLSVTYSSMDDIIGIGGVSWTNDATLPWTITRSDSKTTLLGGKKDGLTSGSSVSTLKARVTGPGTLQFNYNVASRSYANIVFAANREEVESWESSESGTQTYKVPDSRTVEFSWAYTCPYYDASPDADPYSSYYYGCISDVSWTPDVAPAAPTGLTASNGEYDYGTLLRWEPSANATSYAVYRSASADVLGATLVGTTDKSRYWDRECEAGKTHWYWVKAVNEHGESDFSASVSGRRPAVCRLAYNANGGNGSMESQTCRTGDTLVAADNAFKFTGRLFSGWSTTADGSVVYNPGDSIPMTSDILLYAVWEISPFDFGGDADWKRLDDGAWQSGEIGDNEETWIQRTVSGGGKVVFEWNVSSESRCDKLIFYIDGEAKNSISGDSSSWRSKSYEIPESGSHVLRWTYAKDGSGLSGSDCGWVRNVAWEPLVTVVFDANGGNGGNVVTGYSGEALTPPTVKKPGHRLIGWEPELPSTIPNGNVTYVARWEEAPYRIVLNDGGSDPMTFDVALGEPIGELPVPKREGCIFLGWFTAPDGGEEVTEDTIVEDDMDVYAHWMEVWTVTFDANGGEVDGESVVLAEKGKAIGNLPEAVRTGYAFNGWFTKASGGSQVKPTTKIKKNVTYYAQWTANKYKIKFYKNGGSGSMKTLSATYDKEVTLTANAFKRTNYTFLGWATSADGEAEYADKAKVNNLIDANGKTVKLYATWKRNTYTVKFNANGGEGDTVKQTVNCGEKTALDTNAFTREGYQFAGWATKKNGSVTYKNKAKVTDLAKNGKSVTLYAVWKPAKWAIGTFEGEGEIGGKAAKVTLTVSSAGKISGKFVVTKGNKSYSFKADGFDGFADGALRATTTMKYGSKSCTLMIAVGEDKETGKGVPAIGVTYKDKAYGWGLGAMDE